MPYFNDDGTAFNPDLIPKPSLCVACANDDTDDEFERMLCSLTRADQQGEEDFICYAYLPKTPAADVDTMV